MKIWATKNNKYGEYTVGMDMDSQDIDSAMNVLYRMARNLFTEELELFWQEGEEGKAFKYYPASKI